MLCNSLCTGIVQSGNITLLFPIPPFSSVSQQRYFEEIFVPATPSNFFMISDLKNYPSLRLFLFFLLLPCPLSAVLLCSFLPMKYHTSLVVQPLPSFREPLPESPSTIKKGKFYPLSIPPWNVRTKPHTTLSPNCYTQRQQQNDRFLVLPLSPPFTLRFLLEVLPPGPLLFSPLYVFYRCCLLHPSCPA